MILRALVSAQIDVNRAVHAGNYYASHDGSGRLCDPAGELVTEDSGLRTTVAQRNTYIAECIQKAQSSLAEALKHYAAQMELFQNVEIPALETKLEAAEQKLELVRAIAKTKPVDKAILHAIGSK